MRSYPIAEEFFNSNQFEKNTISVIGCGRIGILQACLFADAGFKVLCTDIDPFMAVSLSKGKVPFLRNELAPIISKLIDNGKLSITNNLEEAVSRSRSIVITAPVSVDERGRLYLNRADTTEDFFSLKERYINNYFKCSWDRYYTISKRAYRASFGYESRIGFLHCL
ncbi:MAG: hypothetical protein QXT06_03085 [Candidatus Bathyarchaeia archaeon]